MHPSRESRRGKGYRRQPVQSVPLEGVACSGERTLFMSKEFTFEKVFGIGAVDRDERRMESMPMLKRYGSSNELFSGSCFAADENSYRLSCDQASCCRSLALLVDNPTDDRVLLFINLTRSTGLVIRRASSVARLNASSTSSSGDAGVKKKS